MSSPGQIPLSWLLNGGCHCSPLKYCSRGPNNASHPTTHKCSGVQINLHLKLTTKNIPNLHLFIHQSIHLTYHKNCISNLHYPSIHPYIWLPTKTLKLTQIHPSIPSQTYTYPHIHLSCISNLHYPSFHPSIWLTTETISNLHYPSFHPPICLTTKTISNLHESILPSYFKLTLIHSSIHLSCISHTIHPCIHLSIWHTTKTIANLHYPSIHPSFHPSIHTSDLPQKVSQTYTNPSINSSTLPVSQTYTIHLSNYPSDHPSIWLTTKTTSNYTILSIHTSIHLTYHKNYLKLTLIHHPSFLYVKLTLSIHPSIHPYIWLTTKTISNLQ